MGLWALPSASWTGRSRHTSRRSRLLAGIRCRICSKTHSGSAPCGAPVTRRQSSTRPSCSSSHLVLAPAAGSAGAEGSLASRPGQRRDLPCARCRSRRPRREPRRWRDCADRQAAQRARWVRVKLAPLQREVLVQITTCRTFDHWCGTPFPVGGRVAAKASPTFRSVHRSWEPPGGRRLARHEAVLLLTGECYHCPQHTGNHEDRHCHFILALQPRSFREESRLLRAWLKADCREWHG